MKLYRHLTATDWQKNLYLTEKQLPQTIIVHGEWEHKENINYWQNQLHQQMTMPKWNTVVGTYEDRIIGFSNVYGAPQATNIVHQFACAGTQTFIQTGYYGGLSENLEYGMILIVTAAKMVDGVSHYYSSNVDEVQSSKALVQAAIDYCEQHSISYVTGKIVTVSSLFVEDEALIKQWINEGYIGIDMETATTLTIANYYNRKAIGLLNMSDLIVKDDSLYSYTEERAKLEQQTDDSIKALALHLATLT